VVPAIAELVDQVLAGGDVVPAIAELVDQGLAGGDGTVSLVDQ
jgi:hypothetical protein